MRMPRGRFRFIGQRLPFRLRHHRRRSVRAATLHPKSSIAVGDVRDRAGAFPSVRLRSCGQPRPIIHGRAANRTPVAPRARGWLLGSASVMSRDSSREAHFGLPRRSYRSNPRSIFRRLYAWVAELLRALLIISAKRLQPLDILQVGHFAREAEATLRLHPQFEHFGIIHSVVPFNRVPGAHATPLPGANVCRSSRIDLLSAKRPTRSAVQLFHFEQMTISEFQPREDSGADHKPRDRPLTLGFAFIPLPLSRGASSRQVVRSRAIQLIPEYLDPPTRLRVPQPRRRQTPSRRTSSTVARSRPLHRKKDSLPRTTSSIITRNRANSGTTRSARRVVS